MPKFQETQFLPYDAKTLYDLVMDIQKYHEFLPYCLASEVLESHKEHLKAMLIIGYKDIKTSYTSRVSFVENASVKSECIDGPFEHLVNEWRFKAVSKTCTEVTCFVDFKFSSSLFNLMMEKIFKEVSQQMMHAFAARARDQSKIKRAI